MLRFVYFSIVESRVDPIIKTWKQNSYSLSEVADKLNLRW